ncbi:MAG: hypothetical protein QNL39_06455 [Akkermansiaceae bacterium]
MARIITRTKESSLRGNAVSRLGLISESFLPLRKTEEGWMLGASNKPVGWLWIPRKSVGLK